MPRSPLQSRSLETSARPRAQVGRARGFLHVWLRIRSPVLAAASKEKWMPPRPGAVPVCPRSLGERERQGFGHPAPHSHVWDPRHSDSALRARILSITWRWGHPPPRFVPRRTGLVRSPAACTGVQRATGVSSFPKTHCCCLPFRQWGRGACPPRLRPPTLTV